MLFIGRQDRLLLAGLAAAALVVFTKPLRYLLGVASEVERDSGLALVPALIILTVALFVHLQVKGHEADISAAAAKEAAEIAQQRAAASDRLLEFGQALGR